MSDTPPQGNFIAGQNRGKPPGSRQPDFTGRFSIPGREDEHAIALWVRKDRKENTYFFGRMDAMPLKDVAAQIDHLAEPKATGEILEAGPNLSLEPHQILLFKNGFKEPQETDTPEEAAKRARSPDFWGRVNPGDGSPRISGSMGAAPGVEFFAGLLVLLRRFLNQGPCLCPHLAPLPQVCRELVLSVLMPVLAQHGPKGNPHPGGEAQELPQPCQTAHRVLLMSFFRCLRAVAWLRFGRGRTEQDGEIFEEREERPCVEQARCWLRHHTPCPEIVRASILAGNCVLSSPS
jgi:hypothetical protein